MAKNIFNDPDFDGFDGIYVGSKINNAVMPSDITHKTEKLFAYMRETGKQAKDISNEEMEALFADQ